jgi:hypothetical protein
MKASALGLHNQPRSVSEIQEAVTAGMEIKIRIIWRERDSSTPIALCSVSVDIDCGSMKLQVYMLYHPLNWLCSFQNPQVQRVSN